MDVRQHFDTVAQEYDFWKRKNAYYHTGLKRLFGDEIPEQATIVEIGCGTGDILASLKPQQGLGVDISSEMISRAQNKYRTSQNLEFRPEVIGETSTLKDYEYVVLADVLEHLENLEEFFKRLHIITQPKVKVIISIANPFWEPILELAEKFKMKMPEGPHQRMSIGETEKLFRKSGFTIEKSGYRLLIPIATPLSNYINSHLENLPIIRNLSFVKWWKLSK